MNSETERLREENARYHQVMEELSVHERMYHTLFESSHDAVFLLDGQTITDCNGRAPELFASSREDLYGRSLPSLSAPVSERGDREEAERLLSRQFEENDGVTPRFFQWSFRRNSGEVFHSEVSLAPLTLYGRQFYFASIRDISRRFRVERDLRMRTAQLQATLESLPFDFWINDLENRTYMQNSYSKQLWGDQNGRHMEEVTDDEQIKAHWRENNRRALEGEVISGEISYPIGGEEKIFHNIIAPVWDNGKVIGILGLNIEITHYKRTQQQLEESLRQVQVLLKEVHHRVKNNLQIISSMVNLEKEQLGPPLPEILHDIENRINTMALIHEHLYDSESLADIRMQDYLENLSSATAATFGLQEGTINIRLEVEDMLLPLDVAIPLGIIVNELLSNCIKHAFPEGRGTVTITLQEQQEGTCLLAVEDDGVGITDPPSAEKGLGLTLVRQLVRQLQGQFTYESGGGFRAEVRFPHQATDL